MQSINCPLPSPLLLCCSPPPPFLSHSAKIDKDREGRRRRRKIHIPHGNNLPIALPSLLSLAKDKEGGRIGFLSSSVSIFVRSTVLEGSFLSR